MVDARFPEDAVNAFVEQFGASPEFLVRAPGRINLIGEHTDYTGGLVLPMAIDRAVWIAARTTDMPAVEIYSAYFDQSLTYPLGKEPEDFSEPWAPYVVGVLALLERQGIKLHGCRLLIGGDLPPGAGLASSAAIEVGVAKAVLHAIRQKRSPIGLATLCRQAEQEYAKSPCGLMDQMCCTSALAGHALLIDCRSMVSQLIPLDLGHAVFVVIDSGVHHSISGKEYAARHRDCSVALDTLRVASPSISSIRDVSEDRLPFLAEHLDDTLLPRVRHVVSENARVLSAVKALRTGDLDALGRLMTASHESLRDDFRVSCEELDDLVSIATGVQGVYGARLTGGGFGGCVIALSSSDAVHELESAIHESYDGLYETDSSVFAVRSADAVKVIDARV